MAELSRVVTCRASPPFDDTSQIPVVVSGVPLDRLFAPDLLQGGYRKRYFRAVSRLVSLAREA